jgi:hypothetical protein
MQMKGAISTHAAVGLSAYQRPRLTKDGSFSACSSAVVVSLRRTTKHARVGDAEL